MMPWLLSERKTHVQFHMETFLERYPKWPELWEELYGENGMFANSSQEICSAPVQNVLANEYKDPTDSPCQSTPLQKKHCHEASPGSQPPSPPLRKKPCCETTPEKLTEETMDGMNKTDEGKGHSGCQNKGEDQYSGNQSDDENEYIKESHEKNMANCSIMQIELIFSRNNLH